MTFKHLEVYMKNFIIIISYAIPVIIFLYFVIKKINESKKYKIKGQGLINLYENMKKSHGTTNKIERKKIKLFNAIVALTAIYNENEKVINKEKLSKINKIIEKMQTELIAVYMVESFLINKKNEDKDQLENLKKKKGFEYVKNMVVENQIDEGVSKYEVYKELKKDNIKNKNNKALMIFGSEIEREIGHQRKILIEKLNLIYNVDLS